MADLPNSDEVPLTVAAHQMRASYHAVRTLMLVGKLRGRKIGARWYVNREDVLRHAPAQDAPMAQLA